MRKRAVDGTPLTIDRLSTTLLELDAVEVLELLLLGAGVELLCDSPSP